MDRADEPWERYYSRGASSWRGSPYEFPDMPPGSRFLDVGCGTGSTLIRAVENGLCSVGIDISPTALKNAASRLNDRGLEAELRAMDITTDPVEGSFDLIAVHYVLGSMTSESRNKVSRKITDILENGGIISFEDLAEGDMREETGEIIEENTRLKGNGIIQHFFREEEVRELFDELSVLNVRTDSWEHGGFQRARILGLFQAP